MRDRVKTALQENAGRLFRFSIVGIVNNIVDLLLFSIFVYIFSINILVSNTISYIIVIFISYLLNKIWTFRHHEIGASSILAFSRFLMINLVGLGISNLIVGTLSPLFTPIPAKICAIGAIFLWNYWAYLRFVYRNA